ncbi:MAG: DUF3108 domain-containing protein [Candidatus Acidiferrales bacterium]
MLTSFTKFGIFLAAALTCSLAFAFPPGTRPLPFAPGEQLTYQVNWSIFSAGRVTASVKQLGSGPDDPYEIDTSARSDGFVSLLFNTDDHFQSMVDPKTLCSREISKIVNEGRRHKVTQIVFDSQRKLALLSERDMSKADHPVKHAENPIPPCVEDFVTAFYVLRSAPLHVGSQIDIPVNDGAKTQTVVVDVQAREQIKTPFGTRYAFRMEPRALGGLSRRKGRMLIWISDDSQRLPLRVKAMMLIGTITGNLVSVTHIDPVKTPAAAP